MNTQNASTPGILIVDDDSELAAVFGSNILYEVNKLGIPVYIFTDASRAKSFIQGGHRPLRAAVVDLWMVDQATGSEDHEAGIAVIKLLRERQPNCQIVALSAHIDADIENRLKDVYHATPMKKPCSTGEVLEAMEQCLTAS